MAPAAHIKSDTTKLDETRLDSNIPDTTKLDATIPDATVLPGGPGYVYVLPAAKLKDKTRPLRKRGFDPIAAAETHVKRMEVEFPFWLEKDEKILRAARDRFVKSPNDAAAFEGLREIIHTVKGNAPVLGCEAAGILATPLSTAMERCTDHRKVQAIFLLTITAICSALKGNIPANDATVVEMAAALNNLNKTCELQKHQAAGKASICSSSGGSNTCTGSCLPSAAS